MHRHLTILLILLLPAAAPPALAQTPQAPEPPPPAAEEPAWQRDAQGNEYRVQALERAHLRQRLDDGKLLTVWGIVVDYDSEDEGHFYYRVYRPPAAEAGGGSAPAEPPASPQAATAPADAVPAPADTGWDALPVVHRLELEPLSRGLPPPARWRNGFRLADLDGDGRLDLVLPPARKRFGGPLLLLGDGEGGWRRWSAELPSALDGEPLRWDYGDVEAADFDGDGRTDLAFAMHLQGLLVLAQVAPGTLTPRNAGLGLGRRDGALPFSSRALRSRDVDGDGRPDLLVLGEGPRVGGQQLDGGAYGLRVFRNLGTGGWEPRGTLPGTEALFGQSLASGDLDGDGDAEIVAASDGGGEGGILVGGGEGGPAAVPLPLPAGFRVVAAGIGRLEAGGPARLVVATTGRDGSGWSSALEVLTREAEGIWRRETVVREPGAFRITAVHVADLDGDGAGEVAAGTADGRLLLLHRRDGAWRREEAEPLAAHAGCRVYHLESGIDGDGSRLLAANRAGEQTGSAPLGVGSPGCPGGGDVHVWRVVPAAAP